MSKTSMIAALVSASAMSCPVSAATLFVNYTGTQYAGTFNINSNPVVKTGDRSGIDAYISNGTGYFLNRDTAFFFSRESGGGFFGFAGPQLYTGPVNAPTIPPVSYTFSSITFSISEVAGAIPEISTWSMLLVGFGMIGAAIRYRRKGAQVRYA